ncbi:MAG: hypothetical protein Q4E07_07280, partial [Eubacteriales bacterium]|nr:hypothetical protein [Eubacteriales bacterium]
FKRYSQMPSIKITNWFLNRDANLFYFYFVKNSEKSMIVIEPSDTLIELIKKVVPSGKYQVN